MKKIHITLVCYFLCIPLLMAQIPANELGLNPLSLKWSQIKTDKVRVVFPRNLEKQGQRVANLVHYLWDNSNKSIGDKMMPVTIFLQNQTTTPNGFVTPGPFRSEFYMTSPQLLFDGPTNWLDMLAIHEYRHVKQFANSRRGITGIAKTLFGSWIWGGVTGAVLPRWYFEGDAVVSETALTNAGRGRQPDFEMEYRSLIMNDVKYGYEKAAAGSFKSFVPDHYRLGYHMINYGRRKYGEELWAGVMQDAVKYKSLFYSFSRSLKRKTGTTTRGMYKKMRAELDSTWKAEDKDRTYLPTTQINKKRKKTVINYKYPHQLADGSIIVEKGGYNEIRTYYKILPNGKEKKLAVSGINVEVNTSLSVNSGRICWAETGYHRRWGLKDFSVIKVYNLHTDSKTKLTMRSRYFAPAISPDGNKIIAVEVSPDLKYSLVVINATTGGVMNKVANPDNNFYSFPKWADNESVVVVRQKGEQNQLQQINTNTGQAENLTESTYKTIAYPFAQGNYVYFTGSFTSINNIYAVKKGSTQLYQVTSARLGAFYPNVSADGKTLVMSEFTHKGYNVTKMSLNPEDWKTFDEAQPIKAKKFYQTLSDQVGGSILNKVPDNNFEVKKYNKWSGLINPHSLIFSVLHPVYGVRLLADNKFSTLSAEVGATYNTNENTLSYKAGLTYAELYPVVNASYQRLNRKRVYGTSSVINDSTGVFGLNEQKWEEDRYSVGLELPINFSGGSFFRRMNLSADYHYMNINFSPEDVNLLSQTGLTGNGVPAFVRDVLNFPALQTETMQALDFRFTTNIQQQRAKQHINPRFWLYWDLRYRTTFGDGKNSGKSFLGFFNFYLPGLAKTHSFYISTAYQTEHFKNSYKFSNFFPYSRGYGSWLEDKALKYGLNYTFPLLYPDLPLTSLLFIKRIKANLFYDFTALNSETFGNGTVFMRSAGVELTFDIRAFRLLEVDLGVRYSYLLDGGFFGLNPNVFDFMLLRIGI